MGDRHRLAVHMKRRRNGVGPAGSSDDIAVTVTPTGHDRGSPSCNVDGDTDGHRTWLRRPGGR
jgi:hypothetical protein